LDGMASFIEKPVKIRPQFSLIHGFSSSMVLDIYSDNGIEWQAVLLL
jgi:hypothetical protein